MGYQAPTNGSAVPAGWLYQLPCLTIPLPIHWARRFFVGRSSARYGYRDIEAAVAVLPSGTLSIFSFPLCLILHSWVSTAAFFVILHICFRPYPTLTSSSHIYLFFPIVSPLWYISATAISISPRLHCYIHCHTCLLYLSYCVSGWAAIINLILTSLFIFHSLHHPESLPTPSLLSYVSAASLLSLSSLYHVSASVVLPYWSRLCIALLLLMRAAIDDLGRHVPVSQSFEFQLGGRRRCFCQ